MTSKNDAIVALLNLSGRLARLQVEELQKLPQPLSLRQYRILSRVAGGATSVTVLAKMADRSLPTISRSVDSLIQRGLLSRTQSAADGRNQILQLTAAGKTALDEAQRALDDLAEWLEVVLSDRDGEWLEDVATRLFERGAERLGMTYS